MSASRVPSWRAGSRARIGRREFLSLAGAGAVGLLLPRGLRAQLTTTQAGRPNVLVIVADDLGYADLGIYGCKDIPTPNIDSLAASGVRCTSGYVTCPVCSPTRAGIMTGRYQQRFGHEFNPSLLTGAEFGLPLSEVTLADALKSASYATGLVGKWHLGEGKFHPLQRGFGEYYGFLEGSHSYLVSRPRQAKPILRGTEPVQENEYLTDAFAREAVAFIDRHKRDPFFLCLTFNAVHTPLQAADKYLQRFTGIKDQTRRTYAAMLSAMDDGVGAVLGKLRREGLADNTLVFFLSDNGGPVNNVGSVNGSSNGPLRAGKTTVYEGGVRVPFLLRWPARLPAGKVYDQPVISLDIFPTAVAAAGAQPPAGRPLDGVNLLPYLTGQKAGPPHAELFWRFGQQAAMRKGDWKLVRIERRAPELYDLAADPGESKDLAAQRPGVLKELSDAWDNWNAQLAKPLWGREGPASRPGRQASRPARR